MVKRRDLDKELVNNGYTVVSGGSHDLYVSKTGHKIPVPRHREIDEHLAQGIRNAASIKRRSK